MFSSKDIFFGSQASGYRVSNSLRFRSSASANLSRTPTNTSGTKCTFSTWIKLGSLASGTNNGTVIGAADNNYYFQYYNNTVYFGNATYSINTAAVYRDFSAWAHVLFVVDTTLATTNDRMQIWVNGIRQTVGSFNTQPGLNASFTFLNSNQLYYIGARATGQYFDGYLAETYFIDGYAYDPTYFGQYDANGIWQPKTYAGASYGTNGFYLQYSDNSSPTNVLTGNVGLGKDFSGNGNYWTTNNISLAGSTVTSFTSTGTTSWTAPAGVTSVRYLVVAGGGGGGYSIGGGGGGGGVLTGSLTVIPGNSYTITVGGGGAGATASPGWGTNGGNSSISGTGITTVTATGGGGGGGNSTSQPGQVGGSGGGAGEGAFYGAGTAGQGFRGGSAYDPGANYGSGGGGGAGGIGADGTSAGGGAGGTGIASSITGSSVFYGGGGGGGNYPAGSAGPGGSGGGGTAGSSGTANTGGGGGGATLGGSNSGAGGSGIVILSYGSGVTYDSMIDSPTNYADGGTGRGNYAVLNPLNLWQGSATTSVTNGNLTCAASSAGTGGSAASIGILSGQFYWETQFTTIPGGNFCGAGLYDTSVVLGGANSYVRTGHWILSDLGLFYANGAAGTASGTGAFSAGDTAIFAFDGTTGKLWVGKNGTWVGTPGTSGEIATLTTGKTYAPLVTMFYSGSSGVTTSNFGQRSFAYTPPSGFSALNSQNLPSPTITNGAQYMAAVTYTGNSSTQTITTSSTNSGNNPNGTSFQPDFVWIKNRSIIAQHVLTDVVRGVDRQLFSSLTNAEQTSATGITSFNSNGFSLGSNVAPTGDTNSSPNSFIAWEWKAGGTGVSNTSGSITSTVSANPSAGFSVVTGVSTGASGSISVGHGLGVTPSMVIFKNRDLADDWYTWHTSLGASTSGYNLKLDTTAAVATNANIWGGAGYGMTSTTIGLGQGNLFSASNQKFVCYAFAPVSGYSAFGSYTGNSSSDGPFVYTGFRPRYVMIKAITIGSVESWELWDTSRSPYNVVSLQLFANTSAAESDGSARPCILDILSNGFKIRGTNSEMNSSSYSYAYACFAENPFKISRAR